MFLVAGWVEGRKLVAAVVGAQRGEDHQAEPWWDYMVVVDSSNLVMLVVVALLGRVVDKSSVAVAAGMGLVGMVERELHVLVSVIMAYPWRPGLGMKGYENASFHLVGIHCH